MRLTLQLSTLAAVMLSGSVIARSEESIVPSAGVGGPHGKSFDDHEIVTNQHRRLRKITMSPCEDDAPLTYLKFEYAISTKTGSPTTDFSEHGILHKNRKSGTLELLDGEYVDSFTGFPMLVDKFLNSKTRLGALRFHTSENQEFGCGVAEEGRDPEKVAAGTGRAFLYFSGGSGDVIDRLTGQTIPLKDYF